MVYCGCDAASGDDRRGASGNRIDKLSAAAVLWIVWHSLVSLSDCSLTIVPISRVGLRVRTRSITAPRPQVAPIGVICGRENREELCPTQFTLVTATTRCSPLRVACACPGLAPLEG